MSERFVVQAAPGEFSVVEGERLNDRLADPPRARAGTCGKLRTRREKPQQKQ
jgi:hypothetical protein